jgi:hypothetical protein
MRPFEFRRAYGRQAHVPPSISLSIVEIGFLDDSGESSKPEDEGGKSASGARPKSVRRWCCMEVRSNYYERRSR